MSQNRIKGTLKSYLRWPLLLGLLLIAMNVHIYVINLRAGIIMSIYVLFYLKSFKEPPLVTIIADLNEFIIINNSVLFDYLEEDLDWSVNPSIAPKCNQGLIDKMLLDSNLMKTIVYPIKETTADEELSSLILAKSKESIIYYIYDCVNKFKSSKAKGLDKQISKLFNNLSIYCK